MIGAEGYLNVNERLWGWFPQSLIFVLASPSLAVDRRGIGSRRFRRDRTRLFHPADDEVIAHGHGLRDDIRSQERQSPALMPFPFQPATPTDDQEPGPSLERSLSRSVASGRSYRVHLVIAVAGIGEELMAGVGIEATQKTVSTLKS